MLLSGSINLFIHMKIKMVSRKRNPFEIRYSQYIIFLYILYRDYRIIAIPQRQTVVRAFGLSVLSCKSIWAECSRSYCIHIKIIFSSCARTTGFGGDFRIIYTRFVLPDSVDRMFR